MIAQDIITRAARILFDTGNVRWTASELQDYVGDGQMVIVMLRPDSNPQNKAVQLVGGSRQSIPSDGIRLLRVTRNMGAAGTTPGKAIRTASREALDNELPTWQVDNPSTSVQHVVFDNIDPTHFYTFPPVNGTYNQLAACWVELIYSGIPLRPALVTSQLALQDQYLPALLDYVLHRAYQKDAQYAGNMQRAAAHLQNFANAMQINMKIEWGVALTPESGGSNPVSQPAMSP